MRVLSLKPGEARVLVEDGVIEASIAHRNPAKTRWDFEAGPYRVTVTGTRFRMSFHSGDESLSLSTAEGQVMVSGGCQKTPRTVSAGEKIELSCSPHQVPAPGQALQTLQTLADSPPAREAPPAPERDVAPIARTARGDRWRASDQPDVCR